MTYRAIKVGTSYRIQNVVCRGCSVDVGSGRLDIFGSRSFVWVGAYCEECTKGIDVVYDYYLEDVAIGNTATFYDLETLAWYCPHLVPRLEKI